MMGFGLLFVLLVAGVIALLAGWRPFGESVTAPRPCRSPLDVLQERYTSGEITKEQYDQMRHDLNV